MSADIRRAYITAANALYDVDREIASEQRRTPSEKYAELRARAMAAIERKRDRLAIELIPLKGAYDAIGQAGLAPVSSHIHFPPRAWQPAGSIRIEDIAGAGDIPPALRRCPA